MQTLSFIAGLLGIVVSLATLVVLLFKGVFWFSSGLAATDKRLTALETKMELWWSAASHIVTQSLAGKAPGNPVSPERWSYLLNRFDSHTLTIEEATELKLAFEERQKKAQEDKDVAVLIALGLGLALLAVLLGQGK